MSSETWPYEMKPQFPHDCDRCVFLGRTFSNTPDDLYYCPGENGRLGSFITRFGPLPNSYASTNCPSSGWFDSLSVTGPGFRECARRAIEAGLIDDALQAYMARQFLSATIKQLGEGE